MNIWKSSPATGCQKTQQASVLGGDGEGGGGECTSGGLKRGEHNAVTGRQPRVRRLFLARLA